MGRGLEINSILKVENLNKRFGGIRAISDLTFEVEEGEIFGVIGPNGAGKTTLLNILTGIYGPDSGKVEFQGFSIGGLPTHRICRLGIVKTYQVPRPFPKLTVLENLLVASLSALNMKKADALEYDLEILKLVALDKVKHLPAGSLLPFQLRRLEMARALACKPKLLLLDEPAAGVRGEEIASLMDVLNRIFKMVSTIILVEHRMEVVLRVARRVMVMHRGMKLFEGKPEEVLNSKIVIEAYLGEERK